MTSDQVRGRRRADRAAPAASSDLAGGWTAVVPVASFDLTHPVVATRGALPRTVARSMAIHVLEVVKSAALVDDVVVVTGDRPVATAARTLGCVVLHDRPLLSVDPLSDALALARSWCLSYRPCNPVVIVPADMAALHSEDVDLSLRRTKPAISDGRSILVPDWRGRGSTLSMIPNPHEALPHYGTGAGRANSASGYMAFLDLPEAVRLDFDSLEDLRAAGAGKVARAVWDALTRPTSP